MSSIYSMNRERVSLNESLAETRAKSLEARLQYMEARMEVQNTFNEQMMKRHEDINIFMDNLQKKLDNIQEMLEQFSDVKEQPKPVDDEQPQIDSNANASDDDELSSGALSLYEKLQQKHEQFGKILLPELQQLNTQVQQPNVQVQQPNVQEQESDVQEIEVLEQDSDVSEQGSDVQELEVSEQQPDVQVQQQESNSLSFQVDEIEKAFKSINIGDQLPAFLLPTVHEPKSSSLVQQLQRKFSDDQLKKPQASFTKPGFALSSSEESDNEIEENSDSDIQVLSVTQKVAPPKVASSKAVAPKVVSSEVGSSKAASLKVVAPKVVPQKSVGPQESVAPPYLEEPLVDPAKINYVPPNSTLLQNERTFTNVILYSGFGPDAKMIATGSLTVPQSNSSSLKLTFMTSSGHLQEFSLIDGYKPIAVQGRCDSYMWKSKDSGRSIFQSNGCAYTAMFASDEDGARFIKLFGKLDV